MYFTNTILSFNHLAVHLQANKSFVAFVENGELDRHGDERVLVEDWHDELVGGLVTLAQRAASEDQIGAHILIRQRIVDGQTQHSDHRLWLQPSSIKGYANECTS
jgi:hypothetical protein